MFVTVTANPSIDRTVEVEQLLRGEVQRASAVQVDPGGKGVNVARALARNGLKARAVVATGDAEGEYLATLLDDYAIDVVFVPVRGAVRSNISVVEADSTVTKLNEAGARLSTEEEFALCESVLGNVVDASWVVAGGSLPPGVGLSFYADLVGRLRERSVKVAVDTSGPALSSVIRAGPDVIKPNLDELEEAVGRRLGTLGEVVDATEELRGRGAVAVLASLGQDGAVLAEGGGIWHAEAPTEAVSSVGAGDALLAGFLAGGGGGPGALAEAVAWGAAAATLHGSAVPEPVHIRAHPAQVHPAVERKRPLLRS